MPIDPADRRRIEAAAAAVLDAFDRIDETGGREFIDLLQLGTDGCFVLCDFESARALTGKAHRRALELERDTEDVALRVATKGLRNQFAQLARERAGHLVSLQCTLQECEANAEVGSERLAHVRMRVAEQLRLCGDHSEAARYFELAAARFDLVMLERARKLRDAATTERFVADVIALARAAQEYFETDLAPLPPIAQPGALVRSIEFSRHD